VCEKISNRNDYQINAINAFAEDSKKYLDECLDFYDALNLCAKILDENGINVYRYRDVSFIMQMMRLSFFCIAFIAILFEIGIIIFTPNRCDTFVFCSFVVSMVFIMVIPSMSRALGKRYVREVGEAYNAFRLSSSI